MIKLKQIAAAVAVAALSSTASAVILTTPDGPIDFGGFDWSSAGSVLIDGYGITSASALGASDTFTLTYQSVAANLQNAAGQNQNTPGLRAGSGTGYEFTISATLVEQVTCIASSPLPLPTGTPCAVVAITPIFGTWSVYYQAVGNANLGATGISGILDGTLVMSGTFQGGDTVVGPQGPTNPGNVTLAGTFVGKVNFMNGAFFSDNYNNTTSVSTLQFGRNTTAWVRPANFDGIGAIGPNTNTRFVGQADANQSFVPEPGSLALAGLALFGVAALARRRKA